MRFYRPIRRPEAFTFDLDDTLYDNRDVILTTVNKTHQALQAWHPALVNFSLEEYDLVRLEVERTTPMLVHDVTAWREATLQAILKRIGCTAADIRQGVDAIMAVFHQWRSQATITKTTHQVLATLSRQVPVVAITNGNADVKSLGIEHYFHLILRAGQDGCAKPAQDLYRLAAEKLALPAASIIHVGDDLITDVQGALIAGYQACWINDRQQNLMTHPAARVIPHIEISRLDSLTSLL